MSVFILRSWKICAEVGTCHYCNRVCWRVIHARKLRNYVTKLASKYIQFKFKNTCLYISFFMKNNISTKKTYFKESELTQISVDFRHTKIFVISKMYSSSLYACVKFVLLHETIGSPENHRERQWMSAKSGNGSKLENIASLFWLHEYRLCDYLPHIVFRFYLIDFQFNKDILSPVLHFLP